MPRPEPIDSYVRAVRLLGEKVRALREDPVTGRHGPGNARLDTIFRLAHELDVEATYLIDPARPVDPLPEPSGRR